ncbi:jacalin-like lectin [Streptomyces sp. NPDC055721]|uniref:jacalin-like lectin n=1 Tax=Streptomyces sp. NPDC127132 TaxID=3345374 RepID=UPI00363ADC4D
MARSACSPTTSPGYPTASPARRRSASPPRPRSADGSRRTTQSTSRTTSTTTPAPLRRRHRPPAPAPGSTGWPSPWTTALTHGGTGGTTASLTLGSREYVTTAHLCRAQKDGRTRIFHARFSTNLGHTLAGGTPTFDCVAHTAPPGWQITGFHGRSGDEIDKIGFIHTQR